MSKIVTKAKLWVRRWVIRSVLSSLGLGAVGGGTGYWYQEPIQSYLAVRAFASSPSTRAKVDQAKKLLALGDAGLQDYAALWNDADEDQAAALAEAWREVRATAPETESKIVAVLHGKKLQASDAGKNKLLEFVPELLKGEHPEAESHCQALVKFGLNSTPEAKKHAVRWSRLPKIRLGREAAQLLADPAAEVRAQVLICLAQTTDEQQSLFATEDLFASLHDSDREVRQWVTTALKLQGLNLGQISLARQLAHPEASERLLLLHDLSDRELVKDPGPWLEWLSKDACPAVRLGAARTAAELQVRSVAWLEQLGKQDPDPVVRRWANYYHAQKTTIRPVGQ